MRILTTLAAFLLAASAQAQSAPPSDGPAKQRSDLMRTMLRNAYQPMALQLKAGGVPDRNVIEKAFVVLAEAGARLPPLWPMNSPSPTEGRYASSPKIWQDKADFDGRLAKFTGSLQSSRVKALEGVEGLQVALAALDQNCNGCHELYRVRLQQ